MPYITKFLHSQLFVRLPYPMGDLSNQIIIVTGSNTGLGFEAVKHLIRLNAALVILAVRSTVKGEAAVQSIIEATGCQRKRLEVWPLDLSIHQSVTSFCIRVNQLERLDAVIQNAGILGTFWTIVDGNESHITINVVNSLLLGFGVLPKLRESAYKTGLQGRLSFVGSGMQYIAKFTEKSKNDSLFDALRDEEMQTWMTGEVIDLIFCTF